ncbi:hypothetical protein Ddye_008932 [Dipteronia dyeriana]|uniref:Uncharacterized protein n=1 Tax=Dipteronia dyeriana TaxID=168575 RepID=A0AAD9XAP9_9ROSI|nr:hypothetical protein Ddye_008932 [Dipteronia dyeriana]
MENPSETFVFSAQQTPDCKMNVDSSKGFEACSSAKRARADHDVLGSNDIEDNQVTKVWEVHDHVYTQLQSLYGKQSNKNLKGRNGRVNSGNISISRRMASMVKRRVNKVSIGLARKEKSVLVEITNQWKKLNREPYLSGTKFAKKFANQQISHKGSSSSFKGTGSGKGIQYSHNQGTLLKLLAVMKNEVVDRPILTVALLTRFIKMSLLIWVIDPRFTWINKRSIWGIWERLDRALCSMDRRLHYSEGFVVHLPRMLLDHCPVLIELQSTQIPSSISKPFRFGAMWLKNKEFDEIISKDWSCGTSS